uniref:Serpin domain-containing protein n=1 Tax=Strigamia maritima TaxID=126957 RepID=T1IJM9_STRMM
MSNGEPQIFSHPRHVESLAKGNIHFVLKFYKQCVNDSTENALLSPLSVSMALAMVSIGARGDTAARLREVLCLGVEDVNIHAALNDVLESFRSSFGLNLHTLNRVYVHEELKLQPEFIRQLGKYYCSNLIRFNFGHDAERARLEVNHDIVDTTQWKVRDLIGRGQVNAYTRLLAVSSLYFKGEWGSKFKPMQTKVSNFHLGISGRTIAVDMMQQRAEFRIAVCDEVDSTIVELPFSSQRISMYVFLPKDASGLALLESKLTPDVLTAIFAGMRRARVTVTLPRFRLSSCYCLQDSLAALGLANLFHPGEADLGAMAASSSTGDNSHGMHIGGLLLKTYVDVNEEGSEASSAAALCVTTATIRAEPEFTQYFVADHPFLFMIRDNLSGLILFVGRLVSPTK